MLQSQSGSAAPNSILPEAVTEEDVANVVSRHTGVPVSKLLLGEREKLLHLENELEKRVVGTFGPVILVRKRQQT